MCGESQQAYNFKSFLFGVGEVMASVEKKFELLTGGF